METAAKWIRRAVAVIVAIFSLLIFLPVGGFFYVFLLTRATISLTLASFLSAMTGQVLSSNVEALLQQSVSFFPTGLNIIWEITQAIWDGKTIGNVQQRVDTITLLTNIVLAILFFVVVMLILEAIGIPGIRVGAIFRWFFGTPILFVLFLALAALIAFVVWQVGKDAWRQYWTSIKP